MTMSGFVDLKERVSADHPLRTIKVLADEALARLSPEFDRMYVDARWPSIPPERLLKASLLIALFSVRSERTFCEELELGLRTAGGADGDDLRVNRRGVAEPSSYRLAAAASVG